MNVSSARRRGVRLEHRLLEAGQDVVANRDGVGDVLQTQAVALHRLQAEEVRLATRRQHQEVVIHRTSTGVEPFRCEIDARHLHHPKVEVLLTAQNGARRFRDLLGLEARGRDLVEQRLKEVVVVAIDEHDLHGGATQRPGGPQAAEPRAYDDDYFVSLRHNAASGS